MKMMTIIEAVSRKRKKRVVTMKKRQVALGKKLRTVVMTCPDGVGQESLWEPGYCRVAAAGPTETHVVTRLFRAQETF